MREAAFFAGAVVILLLAGTVPAVIIWAIWPRFRGGHR